MRRPIPSSGFCNDEMPREAREWYDRWKLRGGSLARDTIEYLWKRAADYPDQRCYQAKIEWSRIQQGLNARRAELRRSEFAREIELARKPKATVSKINERQRT